MHNAGSGLALALLGLKKDGAGLMYKSLRVMRCMGRNIMYIR